MVMEIFQLSISGETHLKRLKRLEIYGKFQSPVQKRAQRAHISREISRNRKLQMGQISQRISGNVCKGQVGEAVGDGGNAAASDEDTWTTVLSRRARRLERARLDGTTSGAARRARKAAAARKAATAAAVIEYYGKA